MWVHDLLPSSSSPSPPPPPPLPLSPWSHFPFFFFSSSSIVSVAVSASLLWPFICIPGGANGRPQRRADKGHRRSPRGGVFATHPHRRHDTCRRHPPPPSLDSRTTQTHTHTVVLLPRPELQSKKLGYRLSFTSFNIMQRGLKTLSWNYPTLSPSLL